ncbi:YwqG family protein [Simiduia litorea]|uniref:YwqG family protein n=1 Tax=Simiduia litorea TaxID=1435348 RepID=UPI0036F19C7C
MKLLLLLLVVVGLFFIFKEVRSKPKGEPAQALDRPVEPADWPRLRALLTAQALPSIKISLADDEIKLPSQSKFGGSPYWPKDRAYPVDKGGKPLNFIAQINFSEVPAGLDSWPKRGLLQFFIANDDLYGLEFLDETNTLDSYLNSKKNFAVVYHAELDGSVMAFEPPLMATEAEALSPYRGESAITFSLTNDLASPMDHRFETIVKPFGPLNDELEAYAYDALIKSPDHKMGGYASFTQEDPRGYYAPDGNWLLLFQMDTDANEKIDIMWGDVGIGNFFIRESDLRNLNFDQVWYNWDCH